MLDFVEGKIRRVLQDLQDFIYPDKEPVYAVEIAELKEYVRQNALWDKFTF